MILRSRNENPKIKKFIQEVEYGKSRICRYAVGTEAKVVLGLTPPYTKSSHPTGLSRGLMEAIRERFQTTGWVQGHLLNEELGGHGDDHKNLVPLTYDANSEHSKKVEQKIKNFLTEYNSHREFNEAVNIENEWYTYGVEYTIKAEFNDHIQNVLDKLIPHSLLCSCEIKIYNMINGNEIAHNDTAVIRELGENLIRLQSKLNINNVVIQNVYQTITNKRSYANSDESLTERSRKRIKQTNH